MEAWEQFAAALAASPAVEELVFSPRALCGDDEAQWDQPWMAVRGKGFAATCVLRATGVNCPALGPADGEIDCEAGWNGATPIALHRVVTSRYGGCGQGGTTFWNLAILRPQGKRLLTVAKRSLGSVAWSRSSRETWGVRLIPSLGRPGVVLLALAPGTFHTGSKGNAIRADAGVWQIREGMFIRAPDV